MAVWNSVGLEVKSNLLISSLFDMLILQVIHGDLNISDKYTPRNLFEVAVGDLVGLEV